MASRWVALSILLIAVESACGSEDEAVAPVPTEAGSDVGSSDAHPSDGPPDRAVGGDAEQEGDATDASFDAGNEGDANELLEAEAGAGADAADATDAGSACSWTSWTEGLSGGSVGRVQFDPRVPATAFALAGSTLYGSADSGKTWKVVASDAGTLTRLGFPPGQTNVVIGASSSGFERSEDGGQTWKVISLAGLSLGTLLVHPAQPQRLFAGGDQGLLMRSTDGGNSWYPASAGIPFSQIIGLAGDPSNPDVVVAAVALENSTGQWTGDGAILRSENGGAMWQTVLSGIQTPTGISQCAADPQVILVATWSGLATSVNGGSSWSTAQLTGSILIDVAIAPSDCTQVYVSGYTSGTGATVRSTNGGSTWSSPLTNGMSLQASFQQPESLAVDPANPSNLIAGTHDGLFRSANAGDLWAQVPGIQNVLVSDMAVSPLAPGHLWMSSSGSGLWQRPTPTAPWERVPRAQVPRDWVLSVYPDSVAAGRVFTAGWLGGGDAWRSTDNGATFQGPLVSAVNPWIFQTDPTDPNIVYMGTQIGSVQKSTNGGQTWTASGTGAESVSVRSLLIDPANSKTIYIGTESNGIYRSTDSGGMWNPVLSGPTGGRIASLVKTDGNSSAFFAWVNGLGVYRSTDGSTWTASNKGIASLNAGGLVYDRTSSMLFADSGSALYRSADGVSWQEFDPECPSPALGGKPVIVSDGAKRWIVLNAYTKKGAIAAHPL
jgi:photosystem II stability/assembly factor-like uncharacterized protein